MAVKGIYVSDAGALNERNEGLANTILSEARGSAVPLFALSAGLAEENASGAVFSWYEEGIWTTRSVITAVPAPGTGNLLTVEDTSWITENMVMMIESTGEYIMVLGVTNNVLTVQRGISGTQVSPIVVGGTEQALQLIGTAFEEASERPTAVATSPFPRTNMTEIFRRAWDISGTAQATQTKFGNRLDRNKATAGMMHALDMEYALLWGKRHQGVINNKPIRLMDGVLAQLRSNIFVAPAGGLTRRSLDDFVERLFSKNIKGQPNERISFCGNAAVRALNEITMRYGSYNIQAKENEFGIEVFTFITPFGRLTLAPHPLMNDSPIFSSELYTLHPAAMSMVWLRKTFHLDEGQNGGSSDLRDAKAGVYTSELSVKYAVESTGAIMTGITVDHFEP